MPSSLRLYFLCIPLACPCGLQATPEAPPIGLAGLAPGFSQHVINAQSTYCACAVDDVNADGRPDIVCGAYWYEAPGWERHQVREIERIRGRFDGYAHLMLDVDGDGDRDVITVNYRSASLQWFEHPSDLTREWDRHYIDLPGPMETGRLHDIDGDGRDDILPNGANFAAWWRAVPESAATGSRGPRLSFVRQELPPEVKGHGLGFGDIDGDGRGDILAQKGWLAAPEDRLKGTWTWQADWDLTRASIPMLPQDVDGDGDTDVIWSSAHDYGIFWMEQRRDPSGARIWTTHPIDGGWSQSHALLWGDLDGDGTKELIAGKRYMAHDGRDAGATDPLVLCRYQYDPAGKTWLKHSLTDGGIIGFGLDPKLEDLDLDGDLDLICPGRTGLYWLENRLQQPKANRPK